MTIPESLKAFFKLDRSEAGGERGVPIQPQELTNFAAQIVEEFRRRVDERRPFELQWRVNQNFMAGNQYCDIFPDTVDVENIPVTHRGEVQAVYNQIAPIINTRLSKLSRVHPGLVVRPMTNDVRDIMTAKVGTKIIKAAYADQDMSNKGKLFNIWSEQIGGVLAKTVWDVSLGMRVGSVGNRDIYEGDIDTIVVPYYEFFPSNCYEDDLQKMDSIIHAKVYSVDEIENRWGVRLPGKDINVYAVNTTGVIAGGAGFINSMPTITEATMRNSEMVLEYYERPNATFPDGRHAIVIGESYVAHLGPLEYRVGKYGRRAYPFAHQRCMKWPGVFWGTSIVTDLLQVQRDYNATHNMIKEYLARMGIGNLAYQDGALEDDSILDDGLVPGQVVVYRQGYEAPKWLIPEEVPISLTQRIPDLRQEFVILSGVSEMARSSQTPASISSGNALEVLKEQDDTRLAMTADNIHEFMRDIGVQYLRLFKQYAVSYRLSRIVGEDSGDVFVFVWDQNTITSDDVIVNTTNEMLNTPAQRRQRALELYQAGFFNDPDTGRPTREGRAKVLEIYEMGNIESMIDIDEGQMANAQRENMETLAMKSPTRQEYDNDSLHYVEHMRFVLGSEYKDLVERHPDIAQNFLNHMLEHREAAVQDALSISGQGAAGLVANGNPIDTAVAAEQQQIGNAGAGQ